jgi:hypothetical protein
MRDRLSCRRLAASKECHHLTPHELHCLIALPNLRVGGLGTGCIGEKPKFSQPYRQLLERGFGAIVLASSSAVACSTRLPMADVTFDAALAA